MYPRKKKKTRSFPQDVEGEAETLFERLQDLRKEGLVLELLRLLPVEVLVGEVTVLGGLEVDWLRQIELLYDNTRTHIKIVPNDVDEFIGRPARCTIGLDKKR